MDARSIAATAANKGYLTPATDVEASDFIPKYHFDKTIYDNRVFDSKGVAVPSVEIQFGPNIKDWPEMSALPQNMLLKVVSEIHDPVTTTDELIPSGETSSYRSNPLGLAEFALSRKDPAYVGLAKEVQKAQKAIEAGEDAAEAFPEVKDILETVKESYADVTQDNLGIGSTIFAVKPGDGSAREQAASCQKVLGDGQISQMNMRQRDTVQTLSTGECFHLRSIKENFHLRTKITFLFQMSAKQWKTSLQRFQHMW